MYKFYWSNLQRKNSSGIPKGGGGDDSKGPDLDMDESKVTAPVSGSQRVLLKLRKMQQNGNTPCPTSSSTSRRPKSFDPRDLFPEQNNNNHNSVKSCATETAGSKESFLSNSRVPHSHSHHFFYNKTWNEAILQKTAKDYEQHHEMDECSDEDPFIIQELRRSPTKKHRDSESEDDPPPPTPPSRVRRLRADRVDNEVPPRLPPKKLSSQHHQPSGHSAILYRSKSCERPKKKETFRLPDPLTRFSSNLTGRLKGNRSASHHRRVVDLHNQRNLHSEQHIVDESDISSLVIGDDRTSLTTQNSSSGEDDISRGRSLQGSSINSNSSTSLADRMRGLRYDVQKRLSRFRSRSAERITNKSKRSSRSPPNRRMTTSSLPIADDFRSHKHTQQTRSGSHSGSKPPVPPPPITYNGPFIGTARALVDCTPSPYDIDALRFKRGDRVDIISMNPNGLWKGKCEGRIGNFKFINVEVLRPERKSFYVVPKSQSISNLNQSGKKVRHDSRESDQDSEEEDEEEDTVDGDDDAMGSSHNDTTISQSDSDIPKTVEGLLKRIGLEEHISVFILNGYEDLDNFMEMDDTELDYLGITNENHRQKIMSAVDLLLSRSETPSNSGGDSDVTLESSSPPPPPTSATTISIPRDSGVFNEPDSDESWSISSSYSTTPFKHHHHQVNATNLHGEDDLSLGNHILGYQPSPPPYCQSILDDFEDS
ncbi:uncharacterized protein [Lepeophtheirus salmonis]|uniref:uncharacterized protein n=1 Tax=Lepeophtheirus salmonis TaxID=72036 RepID=UPI003AF3C84D